jgi:hypothetical protein
VRLALLEVLDRAFECLLSDAQQLGSGAYPCNVEGSVQQGLTLVGRAQQSRGRQFNPLESDRGRHADVEAGIGRNCHSRGICGHQEQRDPRSAGGADNESVRCGAVQNRRLAAIEDVAVAAALRRGFDMVRCMITQLIAGQRQNAFSGRYPGQQFAALLRGPPK